MAEQSGRRSLKPPPPQHIKGVIIYHEDPRIDDRIRQVAQLRHEFGYDIASIAKAVDIGRSTCAVYLKQIQKARKLYIEAFPGEFAAAGPDVLERRIEERLRLDTMLRNQLGALIDDKYASNRVGVFKLLMRNMRELEELLGLLVAKVEHGGEIAVKDSIRMVLDKVPAPVREEYLDALNAVLAAAKPPQQPHNQ